MVTLNDIKQFLIKIRIFDLLGIALILSFFIFFKTIKTNIFHPLVLTDIDNPIKTDTYKVIVLLFYVVFCGLFSLSLCYLSNKFNSLYPCLLYYSFNLASTLLVTTFIKNCVSRPRPDTLTICGNPYSDSCKKTLSYSTFFDQYQSFPSAHSSVSMSASIFLSLVLNEILPFNSFLYIIIKIFPLFGSIFIALTRVRDFKHHTEDIVFGLFLGGTVGLLSFKMFQREIQSKVEEPQQPQEPQEPQPNQKSGDFLSALLNANF